MSIITHKMKPLIIILVYSGKICVKLMYKHKKLNLEIDTVVQIATASKKCNLLCKQKVSTLMRCSYTNVHIDMYVYFSGFKVFEIMHSFSNIFIPWTY